MNLRFKAEPGWKWFSVSKDGLLKPLQLDGEDHFILSQVFDTREVAISTLNKLIGDVAGTKSQLLLIEVFDIIPSFE